MPSFLDETGLQRVRDKINGLYKRRDELIGSIIWWTGTTANIPANAKICNGQAISRTTYSKLFSIIGTSYGSGDGSTTFNLPDLRVSYDNYGRFIRARFSNTVNNKQDDAIRNIRGTVLAVASGIDYVDIFESPTGAFWTNSHNNRKINLGDGTPEYDRARLNIGANEGGVSDNPMAGHAVATSSDGGIRPYNISMIPIIIVS